MSKQVSRVQRRRFLKTALSAGAAVMSPQLIPGSALGKDGTAPASERITVGGIGIGRRGGYDLGCFLQQPDVQFLAVCDIKAKRRGEVKAIADRHHGNQDCDTYRDFRELLDRDDIDAVLIATGPNWHCTASVYAARAGKDMYCEKPCTKNVVQSLTLLDTMRRTGRIFQAGTQRRNLPHFAFACELARTGKLGKLKRVYAHPMGMTARMSGWGKTRTRTGQGSCRLGYVPGPGRLATVQQGRHERLPLREGRRAGRRRRVGVGFPLRRSLPMGRRRYRCPGRVQSAGERTRSSAGTKTESNWSSAKKAGSVLVRALCVSKARRVGSKRATAASSC